MSQLENCPHGRLAHVDCELDGPWKQEDQLRLHDAMVAKMLVKREAYMREKFGDAAYEESLEYWRRRLLS